jgi:uncharacterized damage-inducible protein DinB
MTAIHFSLLDHHKRMLAYDQWAMRILLEDLAKLATPDPTASARLSHILVAEELWLCRLTGADTSWATAFFPEKSAAESLEKLAELHKRWNAYLGSLTESDFGKPVSYKNTKGQVFELPVEVVLTHVFDHSTYHRGQAATAIKKAGGQPRNTGFSAYMLENFK